MTQSYSGYTNTAAFRDSITSRTARRCDVATAVFGRLSARSPLSDTFHQGAQAQHSGGGVRRKRRATARAPDRPGCLILFRGSYNTRGGKRDYSDCLTARHTRRFATCPIMGLGVSDFFCCAAQVSYALTAGGCWSRMKQRMNETTLRRCPNTRDRV